MILLSSKERLMTSFAELAGYGYALMAIECVDTHFSEILDHKEAVHWVSTTHHYMWMVQSELLAKSTGLLLSPYIVYEKLYRSKNLLKNYGFMRTYI